VTAEQGDPSRHGAKDVHGVLRALVGMLDHALQNISATPPYDSRQMLGDGQDRLAAKFCGFHCQRKTQIHGHEFCDFPPRTLMNSVSFLASAHTACGAAIRRKAAQFIACCALFG
jgi:hypothetical protein